MRGGRRPGAGRKVSGKYGKKDKMLVLRVSASTLRKLSELKATGVSMSDYIEGVIQEFHKIYC